MPRVVSQTFLVLVRSEPCDTCGGQTDEARNGPTGTRPRPRGLTTRGGSHPTFGDGSPRELSCINRGVVGGDTRRKGVGTRFLPVPSREEKDEQKGVMWKSRGRYVQPTPGRVPWFFLEETVFWNTEQDNVSR